jgi:cell wall-associated NlpC family hydrolase
MRRAQIAKVNVDSVARAAELDARAKQEAAAGAKRTADTVVATAQAALAAGLAELRQVDQRRAELERQLDALTAQDSALRAQRQRYLDYQAQVAAAARAAAAAAAGRVSRAGSAGAGGVQGVIDRALSQVGVTYAWGGGNTSGPTRGIRDGGVADAFGDYRKTGFDCSGLMLYAFGGAGIGLPHYSGYQYNAGKKVPISQIRPGDMLFWANGADIHHVALYIGDGKMVEAPYSGGAVRISPVRYGDGLMPYATRLLG